MIASSGGKGNSYYLDEEQSWAQRDFGLDRRLQKALAKCGFVYPTVVQSQSLPLTLQGRDLLCRAKTGAGKTVAFALPVLQRILTHKSSGSSNGSKVRSVILAPTKELIRQIHNHMQELTYYCRDVITLCALVEDDAAVLRFRLQQQPDIIISTPAKLVQQLDSSNLLATTKKGRKGTSAATAAVDALDLSQVELLVLDEADLVLSFGYAEDVHRIISCLPKIFQGILMSATLSPELDKFKRVVLHKPVVLQLEEPQRASQLTQYYLPCAEREKFLVLYVFLKLGLLQGKGLVFINDVNKCYRLKLFLQQFFINAAVLNSEVPLNSRLHIIEEFNRGVFDYLIATDASLDHGEEDDTAEDEEVAAADTTAADDDDSDDDNSNSGDEKKAAVAAKTAASKKKQRIGADKSSNSKASSAVAKSSSTAAAAGYGVSRGIDFQGVDFVVNFDFPATVAAYTHRVGRTARGTAAGTALSFVTSSTAAATSAAALSDAEKAEVALAARDAAVLREVQLLQPRLATSSLVGQGSSNNNNDATAAAGAVDADMSLQPSLLQFNMRELETFRYRVVDTLRGVTSAAVKELRAAELKREILNSEKLKSFFAENPNDLKVLRHDKAVAHPLRQKEHLKFVPDYLVPASMRGALPQRNSRGNKRKRIAGAAGAQELRVKQSKQRNPLFAAAAAEVQQVDTGEATSVGDGEQATAVAQEQKVYSSSERLGESISGRQEWKMRHKKGKFNTKHAKKSEHRTPGSFIKSKNYK